MRRALLLILTATALVVAACSSGADTASEPDEPGSTTEMGTETGTAAGQPNILYVLADDMALTDVENMPNLQRLIGDHGVTFANDFVTVSLCCPSRTTVLRGQYSHNTHVESNRGNGGFIRFHEQGLEDEALPTWLQDAGYRTALIGKYLNDYPQTAADNYVPPGWDEWDSPVGINNEVDGNLYNQYGYLLNENGDLVDYGSDPGDYAGTVYVNKAREFIQDSAETDQPFFAYLSLVSPHAPATPAPQDENADVGETAPRPPNYDESDVSDKPQWVQDLPPINPFDQQFIDGLYVERQRSIIGIDRAIGQLVRTLRQAGELDNTYIVFTSDNGQHLGHHGLQTGKQTGYDEDIHMPLLVRGPGVPEGETADAIVANTDLGPTFADLAGAEVPDFVDGRSFANLLTDPSGTNGRQSLLIEHWVEDPGPGEDLSGAGLQDVTPEFHGIRTARYTYIEYDGGDVELYDDVEDPYQLENLAETADPELLAALHERVADLVDCQSDACREAEDADVPG